MKYYFNLMLGYRKYSYFLFFFIALSFLVFFPTALSTPLWDDWQFIFRNYVMRKSQSPFIYFRGDEIKAWPILHAVLWAMLHTFKTSYPLYHYVSIALHGINGFLCWYLLSKLKIKNSLLVAALYLIHPLQLFSIGWIIQIKTLLSVFFFLVTLIFYEKYHYNRSKILYWLMALSFALSIFSKSTTAILPLCFFISYPLFQEYLNFKKFILLLFPFLLLSLLSITATAMGGDFVSLLKILTIFFLVCSLLLYSKVSPLRSLYSLFPYIVALYLFQKNMLQIPNLIPSTPTWGLLILLIFIFYYFITLKFPQNINSKLLIAMPITIALSVHKLGIIALVLTHIFLGIVIARTHKIQSFFWIITTLLWGILSIYASDILSVQYPIILLYALDTIFTSTLLINVFNIKPQKIILITIPSLALSYLAINSRFHFTTFNIIQLGFLTLSIFFFYFFINYKKIFYNILPAFISFGFFFAIWETYSDFQTLTSHFFYKCILSSILFFRYITFLVLPINNVLFSANTAPTLINYEFLTIFFLGGVLIFYLKNCMRKYNTAVIVGIIFFSASLLPFCGILELPMFSYTNFVPYWLSIPFLGLIPLVSQAIQSRYVLTALVIILAFTTHVQTYQFVHTENVFLNSLKINPHNEMVKVALVEHYVKTDQCPQANELLLKIKDKELIKEFHSESKVKSCEQNKFFKL